MSLVDRKRRVKVNQLVCMSQVEGRRSQDNNVEEDNKRSAREIIKPRPQIYKNYNNLSLCTERRS